LAAWYKNIESKHTLRHRTLSKIQLHLNFSQCPLTLMASQHGLAARVVEMQGGHHFGGDYEKLAAIILEHYKQ